MAENFKREVFALTTLDGHRNLIKLLDVVKYENGTVGMVFEQLDMHGMSWLDVCKTFSDKDARHYFYVALLAH